jgi:acyl-CoA synthetase (AMP-forming)/AMP-acid ligase II
MHAGQKTIRDLSLLGALSLHAGRRPGQTAYVFLGDGEVESERLTYGELDARARAVAAGLRERHARGERALLLYPPGLDFITAFFGCLYAGLVAVPFYPPRPRERASKLAAVAADAGATALICPGRLRAELEGRLAEAPELRALAWLSPDQPGAPPAWAFEPAGGDEIAFLQYTSGSTGSPKGVMVTHANLAHNERMIAEAFGHTPESVVVGWLPFFHDMGLIGNVMQPLWLGATGVFMPPAAFLQKPARWLRAVSNYRATTSGGPNFAFDLCAAKIAPEECEGLDLSSWRLAFNGAEPVARETMRRFADRFAPQGFRGEAFYPCYGLAEATLLVTGGAHGGGPRSLSLRADGLERGCVEIAAGGEGAARELVSNGRPRGDLDVAVVDPASGARCAPDRVGEIWVRGPTVAAGYWGQAEATREAFGARLEGGEGPYLRTGDLGFLRGGELYVTGRLKDVLIVRGRKHYPQDVERSAVESHPALGRGAGSAAAFLDGEGEGARLVVACEVRRDRLRGLDAAGVVGDVREAVAAQHGLAVHAVLLLPPGGVPRTTSGKVRRGACRQAYLDGALAQAASAVAGRAERRSA